jgi:integrase
MPLLSGEAYFALTKEWRLWRGHRSFRRRPAQACLPPNCGIQCAIRDVGVTSIRGIDRSRPIVRSGSGRRARAIIPSRPVRPLSTTAMSMLLHRLDATITVHGFRSSFRDWAAETGVEFSVAEQCLAHAIGGNVTRSLLRTSMLELRRPVIASWASFVCGETGDNVIELRRTGA